MKTGIFLTAEWRHLVMLNYEIDPLALKPFVPAGTDLDLWQGRALVSIVGFLFLDTRVLGVQIPFHQNFEEINLRFYVRRRGGEGWRRGVVFIKEIVPRRAIAKVASVVYNENYVARSMRHLIEEQQILYEWQERGEWNRICVILAGELESLISGTEEEFITEHYWGYSSQRDGSTLEYRVEHPPWRVQQVSHADFQCDVARVYGAGFVDALRAKPVSAFVAEGSKVVVRKGVKL
jgi:uncharacterized protein YqjF (DUF2071 family)